MRSLILILISVVTIVSSYHEQKVSEELFITHLPDARTMVQFEFKTTWDMHPITFAEEFRVRHYGIFPKSLAEVMSHYKVQELHLSLTQGKWRTRVWGYPPISSPPGAELWAWFIPESNAESEWPGLVNALSGLLCAHLNAIGPTSTYQPLCSFKPHGAVLGNLSSSQMRYAALPRETVCMENFTPWTKLLPCGASAGLGSLFSALTLYDTDYHSLGVHFTPICKDPSCTEVGIELKQTLTVVFSPSINKGYVGWNLKSLFGKTIISICPLATSTRILIADSCPATGLRFTVDPPPLIHQPDRNDTQFNTDGWFIYNLSKTIKKWNVFVKSKTKVIQEMPSVPVLNVQRFLSGSGHGWGGLHTEISNHHPSDTLRLLYLDMVPWFCRVFIHTLHVENAILLHQHYQPAKDRQKPHMMELFLEVPAQTTAIITVQFNRAFLKWTEHPPDAHHGFYINSAVITTVLSDCPNCSLIIDSRFMDNETFLRLHTEALLISLPTPDFSMPYNVICFVCTVIAIGFGSIFNLTTRRLEPVTPGNSKGVLQKLIALLKSRIRKNNDHVGVSSNKETVQQSILSH